MSSVALEIAHLLKYTRRINARVGILCCGSTLANSISMIPNTYIGTGIILPLISACEKIHVDITWHILYLFNKLLEFPLYSDSRRKKNSFLDTSIQLLYILFQCERVLAYVVTTQLYNLWHKTIALDLGTNFFDLEATNITLVLSDEINLRQALL